MKLTILTVLLAAVVVAASRLDFPVPVRQEAEPGKSNRVMVRGTRFVLDGAEFQWRGVTAFRLAELVASGKEPQAAAYLDWASANGVTVVRVLAMAQHLFRLSPEDGLRALPRLLELAAERGVHVEVVALADTADLGLDLDAHVAAVGKVAAQHPNAFLEIANEPFHGSQHPSLHDRGTLERLARAVPEEVVVAFGSAGPDDSGGGDYVTVHIPRGAKAWDHVTALGRGRELVAKYGRPVVSDEPMGAAAARQPGRRDNSPERFRAAALLTRMTGMHATFHYEGGLQARIPEGVEAECFRAWKEAWTLLPPGIEGGTFAALPAPQGPLYETRLGDQRWVLAVAPATLPAGMKPIFSGRESALAVSGTAPPAR